MRKDLRAAGSMEFLLAFLEDSDAKKVEGEKYETSWMCAQKDYGSGWPSGLFF